MRLLRDRHPYVEGSHFNPKRSNKVQGYFVGAESTRIKEFNPTSRDHIAWVMKTFYEWEPTDFTDKGKPTIDEVVLKDIGSEVSLKFFRCLELTKSLGMLSEGVNSWLKLVKSDRIHHHCSLSCATHRMAHRKPNLGQVPSDLEFRKLFTATPGMVMVGADLAGIELRMLAHYLARYDGGRYGDILLNGDIHQTNADKIGISRKLVKNVTYAFLYGAGDEKIGLTYDPQLPKAKARKKGKEIKQAYVEAIDGLGNLLEAVKGRAAEGYVKAIDGRKIMVDSPHKALNYLLQGSAACIAKRWMVIADRFKFEDTYQLAFIHDELQFETRADLARDLMFKLEMSAMEAGEYYNMRLPITAEAKTGNNWAEVH